MDGTSGVWLGDVIARALQSIHANKSRNGEVLATVEAALPDLETGRVGFTILTGRKGITSVLQKDGQPDFPRTPDHAEAMRTAVLYDLPRGATDGRLAVHVPHGHSCKGIVDDVVNKFASAAGVVLEVEAAITPSALREAIKQDALQKVTLYKYDPTKSDKFSDAAKWGGEQVPEVLLTIPSKRKLKLKRDPLLKFLDEPTPANKRELVTFSGLVFDEAAVTVELPEGGTRTFFVEPHAGGHPITRALDLDDASGDAWGPAPAELSRELGAVLDG
jgi:hypothetical protein